AHTNDPTVYGEPTERNAGSPPNMPAPSAPSATFPGAQRNPTQRRRWSGCLAAIAAVLILAAIASCGVLAWSYLRPTPTNVSVCAVNTSLNTCGTGAMLAKGASQELNIHVIGMDRKPMANASVQITITGANSASVTRTTDTQGAIFYQYTGAHAGSDDITARLASPLGGGASSGAPVIVRWLTPRHLLHPIVFLHGINEDATILTNELHNQPLTSGEYSSWQALLTGLTIEYNVNYIQPFCYVDDRAWGDGSVAANCPTVPGTGAGAGQQVEAPLCGVASGAVYPTCVSQSKVWLNAVELAQVVQELHDAAGHTAGHAVPVTLMGYSMGASIIRTMLAGCRLTPSDPAVPACVSAATEVDQAFFFNAVHEGSWLMTAKQGLDAASLEEQNAPGGPDSPFSAILPSVEQNIFGAVKDKMGLDANADAPKDLTPQSDNIVAHNQVDPTTLGIKYYNFYGDERFGVSVNLLAYALPATTQLPLGDLVLLAQNDTPIGTPQWGGATFCGGCGPLDSQHYHHNGSSYAEWALTDAHTVNINTLIPILTVPDAVSGLGGLLSSPIQHLNVVGPAAQSPGSPIQVEDTTGMLGPQPTSDMPSEILATLLKHDGQSGL
ncbi:MAG: hypothetical protein ABI068_11735, partial [Ktedonobacterales bacterium]